MFCAKCGRQIDDNAKFCKYCGNIASQSSAQKKEFFPCMECKGKGSKRSVVKMIISVVLSFFLFSIVFDLLKGAVFFEEIGVMVLMILLMIAVILYFGFKKRICDVCHGSGRIYR